MEMHISPKWRCNILQKCLQLFPKKTCNKHNYRGFKLIACDGSNLSIAYNPNDSDTSWVSNQYGDTANHLHLNAFYDVFNRIYLDVIIQTASEYQETRACVL